MLLQIAIRRVHLMRNFLRSHQTAFKVAGDMILMLHLQLSWSLVCMC